MKWFVRWLKRFVNWLEPEDLQTIAELLPTEPQQKTIVAVVKATDTRPHTGAFKRMLALKALRAALPGVPDSILNLGIEIAVNRLKRGK